MLTNAAHRANICQFTGDFLAKDGIYESWIKLRGYPFLDPKLEYRQDSTVAKDVMTPVAKLFVLPESGWTVSELESFVSEHQYRGYPLVQSTSNLLLCGYVLRADLSASLREYW